MMPAHELPSVTEETLPPNAGGAQRRCRLRVMLTFSFPAEGGNSLVGSGKINEIFGNLMADLKPEAAYLYPVGGQRGGHFILNLTDSSQVAAVSERVWMALSADVELTPVMAPEDLQKGLAEMPQIVKRFGS